MKTLSTTKAPHNGHPNDVHKGQELRQTERERKEQEEQQKREKYKEEQKKKMEAYKVGGKDRFGYTISNVLVEADEFVVYEIPAKALSDSIRIRFEPIREGDKKYDNRLDEIRVNFCKVKGLLYKVTDDPSVKSRIAHIIALAFTSGHTDRANAMFEDLIREINRNYADQYRHRLMYLLSGMLVTVALIVYAINVYFYHRYLDLPRIRDFIFVVAGGSAGGFLSIALRLNKTVFEKNVSHLWYVTYGVERIFIAMLGAIIIYFAIFSNTAFGFVNGLEKPLYGYVLLAVVAGFSETLIPNLLINLEKQGNPE